MQGTVTSQHTFSAVYNAQAHTEHSQLMHASSGTTLDNSKEVAVTRDLPCRIFLKTLFYLCVAPNGEHVSYVHTPLYI